MIKRHDLVEKILTFLGLACPATVWDKIVLFFYLKKKLHTTFQGCLFFKEMTTT